MVRHLRFCLVLATFGLLGRILAPAIAAVEVTYDFNLPRQALTDSLLAIGEQTATNIVFAPESVDHIIAPAILGQLTVDQAVSDALAGTRLQMRKTTVNGILIEDSSDTLPTIAQNSSSGGAGKGPGIGRAHSPFRLAQADPSTATSHGAAGADPPAPPVSGAGKPDLAEVVVTGSYIPRSANMPSPLTIMTRQEMENMPRTSLGEILAADPAFEGNEVDTSFGTGLGNSGSASINLRGLGPRATLVLLNGRRSVYNSEPTRDGVVTFDINSLVPQIAVERVEVLKDGASAIYGSDAIAGVVNFITRDHFTGLETSANFQRTETGGQNNGIVSVLFGTGNDRSHVIIAAEYLDRDELNFLDYPDVAAFVAANGAYNNNLRPGSFALIPGQTYNSTVPPGPGAANRLVRDPLCGDPRLGDPEQAGVPGFLGAPSANNQVCLVNNNLGRGAIAADQRLNAFTKVSYEISSRLNLGMEIGFSHAELSRAGGYGYREPEFLVPATNPGNVFGGAVMYRGAIGGPAGGVRDLQIARIRNETWRVALLGDGELSARGKWHWNSSATWSKNESFSTHPDTVLERMSDALLGLGGVGCDPATGKPGVGPCEYFNPFASAYLASPGDPQYNDPALVGYIRNLAESISSSYLLTYSAVVNGNLFKLPAGPVSLASGYEYRDEEMQNNYDPITLGGGFAFAGRQIPFEHSRGSNAVFVELLVPALDQLTFHLAGRYQYYAGGIDKLVPKVGLLWTPRPNLSVRATYGQSFRAPDLIQSYGTNAGVTDTIKVPGILAQFPRVVTSPNPNLKPEQANTYTAGVTWNPARSMSLSLDWWRYEFNDLTGQQDPLLLVQQYAATGAHADQLIFDQFGELVQINVMFENFSSLTTQGFDLGLGWKQHLGKVGDVNLSLQATRPTQYEYQVQADQPVVDGLGHVNNNVTLVYPMPKLKANLLLGWHRGGQFAQATLRYIQGMLSDTIPFNDPRQTDSDYYQLDLIYGYTFDVGDSALTLRLGINNVADQRPPLLTGVQPAIPGVYDIHGRTFVIGFTMDL